MQRYERISVNDQSIYTPTTKIIVCAQAILRDHKTKGIIAQLKYQNISEKVINALFVDISCYDIVGNKVEEISGFQYLDLMIKRDDYFGSQTPIKLSDSNTRKINVTIKQIIYNDGTKWISENEEIVIIPSFKKISQDEETIKQAKLELGPKAEYQFQDVAELWLCTCGAINHEAEHSCHICGISKKTLALNTLSVISEKKERRLAEERTAEQLAKEKHLEEERLAKENKKKILKIIVPIGGVVLLILLVIFTKPARMIARAEKLSQKGQYAQALIVLGQLNHHEKADKLYGEIQKLYEDQVYKTIEEGKLQKALELIDAYAEYENHNTLLSAVRDVCSHEDMTEDKKESTCTEGGYIKRFCDFCGYSDEETYKENGHNYEVQILKNVTCTENGREHGVCNTCGDEYTEEVASTGHNWKEATCTADGKCLNCGTVEKKALGHDWNETSSSKKCNRCGTVEKAKFDDSLLYGTWRMETAAADDDCYLLFVYSGNYASYGLYSGDGSLIKYLYSGSTSWNGNGLTITGEHIWWNEKKGTSNTYITFKNLSSTAVYINDYDDPFYKVK